MKSIYKIMIMIVALILTIVGMIPDVMAYAYGWDDDLQSWVYIKYDDETNCVLYKLREQNYRDGYHETCDMIDNEGNVIYTANNCNAYLDYFGFGKYIQFEFKDHSEYVDDYGRVILESWHKSSGTFDNNGIAVFSDINENGEEKYGLMDETGKVVLDALYDSFWKIIPDIYYEDDAVEDFLVRYYAVEVEFETPVWPDGAGPENDHIECLPINCNVGIYYAKVGIIINPSSFYKAYYVEFMDGEYTTYNDPIWCITYDETYTGYLYDSNMKCI